jgi:regulator of sirC expression with transglutaminase-like and TPR domain
VTRLETTIAEFHDAVSVGSDDVPLVRSALLIARTEYLEIDLDAYERRVQDIALTLGQQLGREERALTAKRSIQVANQLMFTELGFSGNHQQYDDPRNLYLNWVLDERKGIPVTLALIYSEVCQRAGLDVRPVGLPGHVICRFTPFTMTSTAEPMLIDVFNGGRVLTEADCQQLVRQTFGGRVQFKDHYLSALTPRQVLQRLLHNLKAGYLHRGDEDRAARVIDLLLALYPWDLDEVRDRGMLRERLGDFDSALRDLEQYLRFRAGARDADTVKDAVRSLRRHAGGDAG